MAYPGYGGGGGPPPFGNLGHQMHMMGQAVGQAMAGMTTTAGYFGQPQYAAGDPLWGYFSAIAGQDGEIDAEELQRCLTQAGIHGTYTPFSLETCRIMIALLDIDHTGKMGFNEFKELWGALSAWKQHFCTFDQDRSGTVEPHEFSQALMAMGYRINHQTLSALIKRYSKNGRIYFDDYVACSVKLRTLTDVFRRRDSMQQGFVNFMYDDFLQCTISI